MPHLWYRDLQDQAHNVVLAGKRLRIGRAQGCWLVLESERVSRVHAELTCDDGGQWTVADLGSVNGTLVNGQTVGTHLLNGGDVVDVGGFELHFIDDSEPVEAELATEPIYGFASTAAAQENQIASDATALETVNALLDEAAQRRSSDLHIEPTPAGIRIRMRIDGVLEQVHALPASSAASLVSRI
ncbi:MAG: FHA domain-containing protein, partial [Phycisphaerae bacterium]|nr:FHA domain-containing protein [Phycisphaerae bacterium]